MAEVVVPLLIATVTTGANAYQADRAQKKQKKIGLLQAAEQRKVSDAQNLQKKEIDKRDEKLSAQQSALRNLAVGGRGKGLLSFNEERDDGLGSTFG